MIPPLTPQPSDLKLSTILASTLILLVLLAPVAAGALAQAPAADWSQPTNISQSGASSAPHLVVDSAGRAHLLWGDQFAGVVAAQEQGEAANGWSVPLPLDLPFADSLASLRLVAAPGGRIHAAWLEKGSLYTSQAPADAFTSAAAWSPRQLLALAVGAFDLAAAENGDLHLLFLRNEQSPDFPAGVYALRLAKGIASLPRPLAVSPYFRGLKLPQAQVSIAAANGNLQAAWSDPSLAQLSAARSSDNGETWSEPRSVDRRQPGDGAGQNPARPSLFARDDLALLVWGAGHQGRACAVYSQFSQDSGASWSTPLRLPPPFDASCPAEFQLVDGAPDADALAFAAADNSAYLVSWSAAQGWSSARPQSALVSFTNPATFQAVALDCRQLARAGERLLAAGCEGGQPGDIWLLERSLAGGESWYPTPTPTPLWSAPAILDSAEAEIRLPVLLAGPGERLHALWSRDGEASIYYALWDGTRWTPSQVALQSPASAPQGLTAVLHPAGLLFVAWSDPAAGGLFYSLAPAAEAINPAAWSAPQELPLGNTASANPLDPQALVQADGRLALVYILPLNEGRGVYLVESQAAPQASQRLDWSSPQVVFDAAAVSWESLSSPALAQAAGGGLQTLWQRNRLPPDGRAIGLYASRSNPGVTTWSAPQTVRDGTILSSQLIAAPGDGAGQPSELHRLWQEAVGGQVALFHQYSDDDGRTWSEAARVPGAPTTPGPAALLVDSAGRVQLLLIANPVSGAAGETPPALQRWSWVASAWQLAESQPLDGLQQASALSAAAPPAALAALYSGQRSPAQAEAVDQDAGRPGATPAELPPYALFHTGRRLAESPVAGVQPTAIVTAAPGASSETPTPAASPTAPPPAPTFSSAPPSDLAGRLGGRAGILLAGAIPAALLVVGLFILLARRQFKR